MSCIGLYKRRVGSNGVTNSKTRLIYEGRKNFERSLKNDPSSMNTRITDIGEINISEYTKTVPCIINDFSTNDQKAFDEKVLYVRHDENVGIGSYVEFDNFTWLIVFKEHISADIYKSFIMKKCNEVIKYRYQDEVYEIPCVVRNLTQYSDGLQDIVYTSVPDSRRSITYSQNAITSNINLGHRFMVNRGNAYRVTHIQDFEYKTSHDSKVGISTCIAVFTALRGDDDVDDNFAYNDNTSSKVNTDIITLASSATYSVDNDNCTWEVEYISNLNGYVKISPNKGTCEITVDMNFDLLGEVFKLRALSLNNKVIFEKDITIVDFI